MRAKVRTGEGAYPAVQGEGAGNGTCSDTSTETAVVVRSLAISRPTGPRTRPPRQAAFRSHRSRSRARA